MQALGSRVIIQPSSDTDDKRGSIIIPDIAKDKPFYGTVISVGEDAQSEIAPGDRVIYPKYGGVTATYENVEYVFIEADEILARLDEK